MLKKLKKLSRLIHKKLSYEPLSRIVVIKPVPYRRGQRDLLSPRAVWEAIASIAQPCGTMHTSAMLYHMCHVIGAKDTVEIGVQHGYTSVVLGMYAREVGGTHTAVDIAETPLRNIEMFNAKLGLDIETVLGDSGKVPWNRWIDLVHIDGDHSYEGCKADINRWTPWVRKGGIVAFHDYNSGDGVKDAVDDMFTIDWQMLTLQSRDGFTLWVRK